MQRVITEYTKQYEENRSKYNKKCEFYGRKFEVLAMAGKFSYKAHLVSNPNIIFFMTIIFYTWWFCFYSCLFILCNSVLKSCLLLTQIGSVMVYFTARSAVIFQNLHANLMKLHIVVKTKFLQIMWIFNFENFVWFEKPVRTFLFWLLINWYFSELYKIAFNTHVK